MRMFGREYSAVLLAPWLLAGCITDPPHKWGDTPEAKKLQLGPCPNGLIDDGEDNNNQIIEQQNRDGYWFTFADEEGSTIEPQGDFVMSPGGPPGSKYAARMRGKMAAKGKSLYVGMGFSLKSPKVPYDATWAKGISFWAKGPGKVRFKTPDINTIPEGDRCTDCYNDFGVDLYLENRWIRYTVPFEKMQQQPGWGDRAPALSVDALFAIQWQFNAPDTEYDIWIDNIEFVGCQ
jgi:endoglucanase